MSKIYPLLISSLLIIIPLFFLSSCSDEEALVSPIDNGNDANVVLSRVQSEVETFRVVRVVGGLERPWGMAWLPDGRKLITERPGRLLLIDGDEVTNLTGLPDIQAQGQGGMLDVEVHPDFESNGWIYFTYSAAKGNNATATSLSRAQLNGGGLINVEILFSQDPAHTSGSHFGSRIAFLDDNSVLITIGDRGQRNLSQNLMDHSGNTLRLNDDGSIPTDNPFVGEDDVLPEIYSYGHRNAQGMVIHPETGAIWQHEHGPRGGDALNIIVPGGNYGWPIASYGTEYSDGSPIGVQPHEDPDIVNPIAYWVPISIAPSGMDFYMGDEFSNWSGNLFIGALAGQHLRRIVLEGDEVVHQEELLSSSIGRIRDVKMGPDGFLYVLTDEINGGLYRLEPIEE